VKDLYNENYEALKKETEEDTRGRKPSQCSLISRNIIVKMAVLLKVTYKFNAISLRIPISVRFLTETEKSTLKFICKHESLIISKAILSKKARLEVSPDLKLYYIDILQKQHGPGIKIDI
jgi:hypothetical protein